MPWVKFGDLITIYSEVRDVNTNKAPPSTEPPPLAFPSLKYKAPFQKIIPREKNLKYHQLPLIFLFNA